MNRLARLACLGLLGILTSLSQPAFAEDAAEPWLQLGVSLNMLSYQRASFDVAPVNSGRSFSGDLVRKNYGPSGSSVTLEPGVVLGKRWVLGLLLDIGSGDLEMKVPGLNFDIYQTVGSFAVGPRMLYFFTDDGRLRPYTVLAFGYTTTPSEQTAQTIDITEYQGYFGLGTHLFLDRAFSLDSSLRVAYGIGSGYVDSPPLEDARLNGSVFTVMWNFGTSGWIR
ncbi:MAG: hypothetical protein QM784_23405 [Polyangiaceae bacterium]